MAQRRRKRVAVVQCYGGCRAKEKVLLEERKGNCEEILAFYPAGVSEVPMGMPWGRKLCGSLPSGSSQDQRTGDRGSGPGKMCGLRAVRESLSQKTDPADVPEYNIYPACVNEDPGVQTRKECDTGCIACGICVKNCPVDAIGIQNDHAVIDEEKCISCGMCAVKCPRGTIRDYNGIFTTREEQG